MKLSFMLLVNIECNSKITYQVLLNICFHSFGRHIYSMLWLNYLTLEFFEPVNIPLFENYGNIISMRQNLVFWFKPYTFARLSLTFYFIMHFEVRRVIHLRADNRLQFCCVFFCRNGKTPLLNQRPCIAVTHHGKFSMLRVNNIPRRASSGISAR